MREGEREKERRERGERGEEERVSVKKTKSKISH